MDLRNFNEKKKEIEFEEEIINSSEVRITKKGDEIIFNFKKKEAISKYQDFLFFSPTNSIITDSDDDAESFFNLAMKEGVEGLMFKKLNSSYLPGLRVGVMAKLKETKEDIDVVIVGAEHGKGRRAGFYSSFLVAIKNDNKLSEEGDVEYLEIGKVSSGIKEKNNSENGVSIEEITKLLEPLKISEENGLSRFKPKIIIQVRYQEIQKSNAYNSGYALRFPRIIMLREDKSLDEINSLEDIKKFSNYN